uniref:Diaphanous-related formin 3 n=1 Tax=Seriola dumerili TaxID=41447 RepID=A0A3B4TKC7_SERDU
GFSTCFYVYQLGPESSCVVFSVVIVSSLFLQLDRFASIRIPGSKKERPPLSHSKHNTNDWSISSSSTSHQFEELSSKITSEKEILALFEKMMEDMNLNEEKKTPLREKDLNTKREMVIQYIFTASKTGALRSSHQISPQEFLGELKSGVMDERLFACLDSLRVSLTSNPVSWVQSFGHEGLGLLLDILERLLFKKQQEKIDKRNQHKVVQCLKAFMNNKVMTMHVFVISSSELFIFHVLVLTDLSFGHVYTILYM